MVNKTDLNFSGRVAIITGAGRGLGRAYALELARRGASVVVNDAGVDLRGDDAGDHGPADAVVQEILAAGGMAQPSYHDIASPEQATALVELAQSAFGGVDILVNNAGINRRAIFPDVTLDDLRSVLDVHLVGPFVLTQAAYARMAARQYGRIVFTTSQVGFYGKVDSVAYGAAKNAVVGLMHGMKHDAVRRGIRVNCISPFALTRMGDIFPKELARLIAPEQVAAAVAWLCSDACDVNGEILIAGGGHFARALTLESRGIDVDQAQQISAEFIRRRWKRIANMRGARVYDDALKAVGATFDALRRRIADKDTHPPT